MAIWFGNPTIDDARASHVGLLASHLGIEFTEWGDDFLRGTMPVEPRTRQPMGYLHGGASLVLAETLGSVAANLRRRLREVPLPRTGDQRQSPASGDRRPRDRHRAAISPRLAQPGVEHRNPRSAGTTGVHLASHRGRGRMAPEMNQHPLTGYTHAMYALHAVAGFIGVTSGATIVGAFVFGLPSIIAILMNYARRDARAWLLARNSFSVAGPHLLDRGGHWALRCSASRWC